MRDQILRFVRDNITLLVFLAVVAIMGAAWIVFEAMRSHRRRDEIFGLRRKVRELETERASDRVLPSVRSPELTVRVDGYAVLQNHSIRSGERLEAAGKNGTYVLELYGVEGIQANLAVALRNRHRQ